MVAAGHPAEGGARGCAAPAGRPATTPASPNARSEEYPTGRLSPRLPSYDDRVMARAAGYPTPRQRAASSPSIASR